MGTTKTGRKATLTIPAEYLEDARSALVAEVKNDGEYLTADRLTTDRLDDLASSARILRRDMLLLDQLLNATGETELTAEHDSTSAPLVHLLEGMVGILQRRLRDVVQFGPMPMGDVLDVAARLRWAAGEAIRLEPAMDGTLTAVDREAVA